MNKQMTLHEWMMEMQHNMEAFQYFWTQSQEVNKEDFPLSMLSGDWDEQFMMFQKEEK